LCEAAQVLKFSLVNILNRSVNPMLVGFRIIEQAGIDGCPKARTTIFFKLNFKTTNMPVGYYFVIKFIPLGF